MYCLGQKSFLSTIVFFKHGLICITGLKFDVRAVNKGLFSLLCILVDMLRRNCTCNKLIPPFPSHFKFLIIPYISKHFCHAYHKNHLYVVYLERLCYIDQCWSSRHMDPFGTLFLFLRYPSGCAREASTQKERRAIFFPSFPSIAITRVKTPLHALKENRRSVSRPRLRLGFAALRKLCFTDVIPILNPRRKKV